MIENREDFSFDKVLPCKLVLVQTTQVFHRKFNSKKYNHFDVWPQAAVMDCIQISEKVFVFYLAFQVGVILGYADLCNTVYSEHYYGYTDFKLMIIYQ